MRIRSEYAQITAILNSIKASINTNDGNFYTSILQQQNGLTITTSQGYSMKQDPSFIVMNVQSYCSDEYNRSFYKQQILSQIDSFYQTWQAYG